MSIRKEIEAVKTALKQVEAFRQELQDSGIGNKLRSERTAEEQCFIDSEEQIAKDLFLAAEPLAKSCYAFGNRKSQYLCCYSLEKANTQFYALIDDCNDMIKDAASFADDLELAKERIDAVDTASKFL